MIENIQHQATIFSKELVSFFKSKNSDNLLNGKIDHYAIKARDTEHYENLVKELTPYFVKAQYVNLNDRRILTATVDFEINFEELGSCNFIEIIEPKQKKLEKVLMV